MGLKYGKGHYFGTRGSIVKTYFQVTSKREAKALLPMLPSNVQASAKDFFNNATRNFNKFSVALDTGGNTIIIMENPGEVQGSYAVYVKVISKEGRSVVYKETYDPQGNLVHKKGKGGSPK